MLGFSSSRGEKVRGRFADELRATLNRVKNGRLNDEDMARCAFENETSPTLIAQA